MSRPDSILLFILGLFLLPEAPAEAKEWKKISPQLELQFPRDHGSHPDYRTEWWYATGELEAESGKEYGFELTIFRRGVVPERLRDDQSRLRPNQILLGHFALLDIEENDFRFAERLRRADGYLAGAGEDDLSTWIGDWRIERRDGDALHLQAFDHGEKIAIDLTLTPEKPLVLQGQKGYSAKGNEPGNASAYISWTRLKAAGTISLGGSRMKVTGGAWFDHEWGTSQLGEGVVGWDWFALRLEDGRDLMIYRLRLEDGSASPFSAGTLVDRDGSFQPLSAADFTISPLAYWKSPETGGEYPIEWRILVPKTGIDMEVKARKKRAEIVTELTQGTTYWEGPVSVSGSESGKGYMELVGYADSIAPKF